MRVMKTQSESQGNALRIRWVCGISVLLLIAVTFGGVWYECLKHTEGHFAYALDDPYIHLAIAKNLAQHGVWGVTSFAPSSASSSPLWTSLLASVILVCGNSVLWPLILGGFASVAATMLVYFRSMRAGVGPLTAAASAFLVFLIGPLFMLPFTGMEHSLQILLDLWFGFWLLQAFGHKNDRGDFWVGMILTSLMCLCRYESIFLFVVPVAVGAYRRDWWIASGLAIGPVAGIGGFGIYSRMVGMPWVPNSILIKGHLPHSSGWTYVSGLAEHVFWTLWDRAPVVGVLIVIAAAVAVTLRWLPDRNLTSPIEIWLWTSVVAALLHASFAMMGFLFRYEGYLLACLGAGVLLGVNAIHTNRGWKNHQRNTYAAGVISAVVALALIRASKAMHDVPKASSDIYLQQFQMARFVKRYYPRGRLAANDIGAISYFSEGHLLDLVGLATDSIREDRVHGTFTTKKIAKEINEFRPDLIVAYPEWFTGSISMPKSLFPVGDWTIPPVTSAASRCVRFYATSRLSAERIRHELSDFQPYLPSSVTVKYSLLP